MVSGLDADAVRLVLRHHHHREAHDVRDGDIHPEEVEHVVELARGHHHEGEGRRAQEGHQEAEVLDYLHPEELWGSRWFLHELRDDRDGPEVVALAGGSGLIM